jgi:glycine/sarcosine N-methyltransferase
MAVSARRIARDTNREIDFSISKSDRYQGEYIADFVAKWDELIDWDRRAAAEGDFFIEALAARGAHRVLDVATGTGFHSVRLMEAGFDVTSADGSAVMLARATANADARRLALTTVQADWRWLSSEVGGPYDAVVCLGNSFTHLFEEADRRAALAEYYAVLNPGGVLILDQRNYDALLDHAIQPRHRFYYCGKNVCARPIHVDPSVARFRYEFADGAAFHLDMFPLRVGYLRGLMADAGFVNATSFGDFKETYRESEPDFIIHVVEKPTDRVV